MTGARRQTPDRLISSRAVAERLGISERTVREMRFDGRLPEPIRLGYRTVRYRESDIDRFIAGRTKSPQPTTRLARALE